MGIANYKSRPKEAICLGIAACAAAEIQLDIDRRLGEPLCRYSSGRKTPDYDAADAFVALCTAILQAEGACHEAIDGDPLLKEREGAIWVPVALKNETRKGQRTPGLYCLSALTAAKLLLYGWHENVAPLGMVHVVRQRLE
jgi:hypothetical protein